MLPREADEAMIYLMMKTFFCTVLFCFLSLVLYSQPPEVYLAAANSSSCTSSIILYPNATYFFSSGCEASPLISFGKWVAKKDSIRLESIDPKTFPVIKSIEANHIAGDSIWITVLDKDGVNITAKISIGLEVSGRGSYLFSSDSTGTQKFVYKRAGGKIVLRTLQKLFSRNIEVPIDTANKFIITLNLSGNWMNSTHPGWGGFGSFALLKSKDDLLTATPHFPQPVTFRRKTK